jgi:hypothetical protein
MACAPVALTTAQMSAEKLTRDSSFAKGNGDHETADG